LIQKKYISQYFNIKSLGNAMNRQLRPIFLANSVKVGNETWSMPAISSNTRNNP